MKTSKFVRFNNQFGLIGVLHPTLGGPQPWACETYGNGVTYDDLQERKAKEIGYITTRPFDTLDLQATNVWTLCPKTKEWYQKHPPQYTGPTFVYPHFVGDGIIYTLVGAAKYRGHEDENPCWSTWSAIDQQTPLQALHDLVKEQHARFRLPHYSHWTLSYVLKSSWKASDPNRRAYEIYVPTAEWHGENSMT